MNPATPDNERSNASDWMQLMQFQLFPRRGPFAPLLLKSHFGSHVGIELYNVTEPNAHTSNLYRCAVLVLMSHLKRNDPSEISNYLVKYHREAQKCIENAAVVDLAYASYLVSVYSIVGGESVQMAIQYCQHFCKCVVELNRKQKAADDWIELLWRDILASLYYIHRDTVLFPSSNTLAPFIQCVATWEEVLVTSYSLLASEIDIASLPGLSMTTEKICHKVNSLCVYMQICLDQFLIRVNVADEKVETRLARDRLCSVVDRLMRLVLYLPNIRDYIYYAYDMEGNPGHINLTAANKFLQFADVQPRGLAAAKAPRRRDTALALLYAFARLLKNMLESNADVDVLSEIHRSAIAICRLSANLDLQNEGGTDALLVKRSLFWAGVILTESTFPSGQIPSVRLLRVAHLWIKSRFHECILTGHHWHSFAILNDEDIVVNEFFRKADSCTSVHDIWKLEAENISLFYYTNTLATWFLGLNLVRFEYKLNIGRSLEVI